MAVALVSTVGVAPPAFVAAVAPLLLPFVPATLLGTAVAAEVAVQAATMLQRVEAVPIPASGFARSAAMEAVSYRAAYVEAAVGRLCRAVEGAEPGGEEEALRRALEAEERHLSSHLEATRRRLAASRVVDGLVDLHGPILGWRHGDKGMPADPRPNHLKADRKNWDTRRGAPVLTGALPGVLPFCTCGAVAPFPGVRMIA